MLRIRHPHSRLRARTIKAVQVVAVSAAVFVAIGAGDSTMRFSKIGYRMLCVCGGHQILLECNDFGCRESEAMRNELTVSLARGDSDSLVEQGFVREYGPTVLGAPTSNGFDQAAYIVPPAALTLGFGLIALVIRAWNNRPVPNIAGHLHLTTGIKLETFREQARRENAL
jgi:cytochrome c-type biogenesis protein CcmH